MLSTIPIVDRKERELSHQKWVVSLQHLIKHFQEEILFIVVILLVTYFQRRDCMIRDFILDVVIAKDKE